MSPDLAQTLITLSAERFGKSPVGMSVSDDFFEALGIDSVQAMDLLTDLEDRFDVWLIRPDGSVIMPVGARLPQWADDDPPNDDPPNDKPNGDPAVNRRIARANNVTHWCARSLAKSKR